MIPVWPSVLKLKYFVNDETSICLLDVLFEFSRKEQLIQMLTFRVIALQTLAQVLS